MKFLAIALLWTLPSWGQIIGPIVGSSGSGSAAVTVVKIGTCNMNFTTSCSITASSGVASTHGVVLVGFGSAALVGTITFTDSASNTGYQIDIPEFTASSNNLLMASNYITTGIASSGTIVIHDSSGGSEASSWVAYDISVFLSAAWFDKSATNGPAFGTSWPSGTTLTTTNAANVNIAAFSGSATNTLVAYSGGCTALDTNLSGTSRFLFTCWKSTTITGTQSVTMTAGTNDTPAAVIASYKQ